MKNLLKSMIALLLGAAVVAMPACDPNSGNYTYGTKESAVLNVLNADEGSVATLNGVLVYAAVDASDSAEGVLVVGDGTHFILVETPTISAGRAQIVVGDKIDITGEVATSGFYGSKSFNTDSVITLLSSGNDVTLPAPAVLYGEGYDQWLVGKGLEYDMMNNVTKQNKPYTVEKIAIMGIYNPQMDYETKVVEKHAVTAGVAAAANPSILESDSGNEDALFEPYLPDVDLETGRIATKKVIMTGWAIGAQVYTNTKADLPIIVEKVEAAPKTPRVELVDNPIILPSGGTGTTPYQTTIMVFDSEEIPTATCDNQTITVTVDSEGVQGGGDQGIEAYLGYYVRIEAPHNPSEDTQLEANITVSCDGATTTVKVTQDPHIVGEVENLNLNQLLASTLDAELNQNGVPFMATIDGQQEQRGECLPLNKEYGAITLCDTPKGNKIQISFDSQSGKMCWYKTILGATGLNVYNTDILTIAGSDASVKIRKVEINGYDEENGDSLTADSGTVTLGGEINVSFSENDMRTLTPMTWVGNAPSVSLTTHMTDNTRLLGVNGIWWMRITYQE